MMVPENTVTEMNAVQTYDMSRYFKCICDSIENTVWPDLFQRLAMGPLALAGAAGHRSCTCHISPGKIRILLEQYTHIKS